MEVKGGLEGGFDDVDLLCVNVNVDTDDVDDVDTQTKAEEEEESSEEIREEADVWEGMRHSYTK